MSSAGTTMPGRAWVSSKPPEYTAGPAFSRQDGEIIEVEPNLFKPASTTYDPQRPGGTIFRGRAYNTFHTKPGNKEKKVDFDLGDKKKRSVRYSDTEPVGNIGREVVTTQAGGLTLSTTKPYQTIVAERDALKETDDAYRRRIQQLEDDNARILIDYEGILKENNILRDKLDKGDDTHIESYQRIYTDRQILREAETAYKKRISQLEHDAKEMLANFENLYRENNVLRKKGEKLEDRLNAIDKLDDVKKISELEKKIKQLEKTIRTMGYEKQDIVKEKNILENQMSKLRDDVSDLNRMNLLLEKENEGYKRGFMALGKNADNTWKDDMKLKTRRQEEEERTLREEHQNLITKLKDLEKTNHELEIINVELKTKNQLLEDSKADFEKQLFELARESGKRTPSAVKRRDAVAAEAKDKKLEESLKKIEEMQKENVQLNTKIEVLNKEKQMTEEKVEQALKAPRDTASSIRRKMETEREIRDLNNNVEFLKEKAKRLEVEKSDLAEQMQQMEVEMKATARVSNAIASDQNNQTDQKFKDLNQQIIQLNDEVKVLTEENLKFKADVSTQKDMYETKLNMLTTAKENLEKDKEALESKISTSSDMNSSQVKEMQDELNEVRVELKLLQPKHEELLNKLEELNSEKGILNQTLHEKEEELQQLNELLKTGKDDVNELAKARRENFTLQREIDDLNNKFKNERINLETDLEELLKNQEFMNTALAEHKVRLDMLQSEKQDLKNENINLVKANERQSRTIVDLQADKDQLSGAGSTITKELNEEINHLKNELKQSEQSLIQSTQELEVVKNEKENQVNKLLKQMNKLKLEREEETKQLKEQSDSLRSEVARLKIFEDKFASMEEDLKNFIQKLNETEDRNKLLTDKRLANLNHVVKEMKSENLANRIRAAEREENELEKHKLELEIKQDAIMEIRKLKDENTRLLALLEDKRAAEEAQDEWTRKRNKFNEIIAQNKRLDAENKRIMSLYNNAQAENLKQDINAKIEKISILEKQHHKSSAENAKLKQMMEEKEHEIKRQNQTLKHSKGIEEDSKRLQSENKKLKLEMTQKDNTISQLKELETTKAKYMDSTANNQRLYEENKRLRDSIEKSKDYKSEFEKMKAQGKDIATKQSKESEENTLLKTVLQQKEFELNREIQLHKDRASNLNIRNKRLIEEMGRLKNDLTKKDDVIIKLRDLESASGKMKDANANVMRLYEENQRLRNMLESNSGGWRNNFQNVKSLASTPFKDKRSEQVAVYVDTNKEKQKNISAEKQRSSEPAGPADKPNELKVQKSPTIASEDGKIGNKLKIKPLLPDINKESSGLTFGQSYNQIHRKAGKLRLERQADELTEEVNKLRTKLQEREHDLKQTSKELKEQKQEMLRAYDDRDVFKSEIERLKKEKEVKSISTSLDRFSSIQEQNKRMIAENNRLREELNNLENQLANLQSSPGSSAQYLTSKRRREAEKSASKELKLSEEIALLKKEITQKDAEIESLKERLNSKEKLKHARDKNKRLSDENVRLKAALHQTHAADVGSRFRDQNITGKIIEGFKEARGKKWAEQSKAKNNAKHSNMTDDSKLMKIEEFQGDEK